MGQDLKFIEDQIQKYGEKKLYWRCVAGMCVTGLAITLPAGIALMPHNLHLGLAIAISGALKAPAYMVATGNTAAGEFITGALLWGSLAVSLNVF